MFNYIPSFLTSIKTRACYLREIWFAGVFFGRSSKHLEAASLLMTNDAIIMSNASYG